MPNAVGRKCQVLKMNSAMTLWMLVRQHPAVVSDEASVPVTTTGETKQGSLPYKTGKNDNGKEKRRRYVHSHSLRREGGHQGSR